MDWFTTLVFAASFLLLIGLYGAAAGVVLLDVIGDNLAIRSDILDQGPEGAPQTGRPQIYVCLPGMPNDRAILFQWWSAAIIFLAALGVALGSAKLGRSGSASKQSFGRLRQVVSLILASVSAASMGAAGDSLFRVLFRWNSDRGIVFMCSVLAAVLILVAGMVTDRKWPLVVPMVLFGVLVLYGGSFAMQQHDLSVALALFLFAFLCRGVPKRRPSDLASWVKS